MAKNISDVKIYNLDEVQSTLEVSEKTLRNYIKAGRLKAVKIGSRWVVSEPNLLDFVNGR